MVKRILSLILALALVLSVSPYFEITADAANNIQYKSFKKTYTLTGDGGTDMVNIAKAQDKMTGAELGYTDQWCAYFVSDCAQLAGQTAAIPRSGSVKTLYNNILNAGGKKITSGYKPGDIIVYDTSPDNGKVNYSHIEIIYKVSGSKVWSVGGNTGDGDNDGTTYKTTEVIVHKDRFAKITAVVRPAYKNKTLYTVTFDANGGSCSTGSIKVNAGSSAGTFPTPTRSDYEFVGWYTDPVSGVRVNATSAITKNMTLYAHWKALTCTITFDPNGGTCSPGTMKVNIGESAIRTFPTPTRENYRFTGWCYSNGTFVELISVFYGDTTLYAGWERKVITTTLDPKGGTCSVSSITGYAGDPIGPLPTPTKEGYEFLGWYRRGTSGAAHLVNPTDTFSSGQYLWAEWAESHDHSYTDITVTEPTCTAQGFTTYSCSCGDSYQSDFVDATGHDEYLVNITEPTCMETGYSGDTKCTVCDSIVSYGEILPVTAHTWDRGTVILQPTTTTTGLKAYVCTLCRQTKTEVIPVLDRCDGGASCPLQQFTDVSSAHWAHHGMDFAVNNGLMQGTGNGDVFSPNMNMTRAMLVMVLWRYNGSPDAPACDFTDVKPTDWYYKAVAWAASEGVVTGMGGGKFAPNVDVSREQLAVILYRFAGNNGVDTSGRADISGYPDAYKVASWAKEAVRWAVAEGIISGAVKEGQTVLAPQDSATRAVVATIMMRYIQNVI